MSNPWHSDFQARVNLAASYISAGRSTSRKFDSCFENDDGDEVATALLRRVRRNPETQLSQNIWRYLARETCEAAADRLAHVEDLAAHAAETRAQARAAFDRMMREKYPETYKTELTPEGEQTVIPGCERNASPKATQLDLFG